MTLPQPVSYDETKSRGRVARFVDMIERVGNRLPDPITLFFILAIAVVVISWIAARAGVTAFHPGTGEAVEVVNLMSFEGLRRMLTGAVGNFTAFPPLGLVIVVIIGIAVTERSGLIGVALKRLVTAVPPSLLTMTVVFAGVMSSMAVDAGYVVLVPLGAMIFAAVGRHPLAGFAAGFAGVSGGFSANLLITSLDPLLAGISTEAARLIDPAYEVNSTANYYFMIASVALLTVLGTWVTAKFVEPRLGRWNSAEAGELLPEETGEITEQQRKGLAAAGIALVVMMALFALMVVPSGAPLRDPEAAGAEFLVQRIRPFFDSIVTLIMVLFLVTGLAYGIVAGTIRSDRDVARMSSEGVAILGSYIVLAFAAAQFIAYFNWSNLGLILAINGASALRAVGFTGLPLLLSFVIVAAFINLFIGSASAKWAVMAPVFVPMFMLTGYSPEVVQVSYRVGDSVTNIITPLMLYFPVILVFAQRYDRRAGIGTIISLMLPYSVAFFMGWIVMLAVWLLAGFPLGPGAPVEYIPGGLTGAPATPATP
ncbi:MAG TPA: AbgT family transporter [Gemmatimonadaceae bacterium]|nr:AbgT family transporter [Gemmatimonadaceae bacterium]